MCCALSLDEITIDKEETRFVMEGRLTGVLIFSSVPVRLLNNDGSVSPALRRTYKVLASCTE